MTDDTVTDDLPEMDSYEITITRQIEVDFSPDQLEQLIEQTDANTARGAIEQTFVQRELPRISPEQKLLGIDVTANGPSDNGAE